jgi:hypothetical protein
VQAAALAVLIDCAAGLSCLHSKSILHGGRCQTDLHCSLHDLAPGLGLHGPVMPAPLHTPPHRHHTHTCLLLPVKQFVG